MKYSGLFAGALALMMMASCNNISEQSNNNQPRRPENFEPFKYKYSIEELYENYSEDIMQRAATEVSELTAVNEAGKYKPTVESLTNHPVPEWFEDAKLGIFLDWGPWSVPGYAPIGHEASTGGSYPDWYEFLMDNQLKSYHDSVWGSDFRRDDFLPLLTGTNLDADEYVKLAVDAGAKYFVPFCKHHGGWTLWESSYTFRNAVEMGPKRDIYRELVDAMRENNMKVGFYFSISEWEYPVIIDGPLTQWDPTDHLAVFQDALGQLPRATPHASFFPAVHDRIISGKIPVRDYWADYMIPSWKEVIDDIDPDLIWYDGGWGSPVNVSRVPEMSAYFYNKAEGRKDVVINDRAGSTLSSEDLARVMELMSSGERDKAMEIYSNAQTLGDYRTPEFHFDATTASADKWEVCRSISPAFGYNWQDTEETSQSSEELIEMFVNIVAGNGNLLLLIGPDGSGKLPEIQRTRLLELGEWLKVNGEGIYATRPWTTFRDEDMFFTQSKDGQYVYTHCLTWPGESLTIKNISPLSNSEIHMLGFEEPLQWTSDGDGISITIPAELQSEENRPGKHVWVIKTKVK